MTIRKRYGDSGHPCLIPVDCVCQSDALPSISTLNLVFLYNVLTRFISLGFISILSIALNISSLSTLSKAFSQSKNSRCNLLLVLSPYSILLLIRCIASAVLLSFLNPYCVFCRCRSSVLEILLCNIAANIFYSVLNKEIGL